VRIDFFLSSPFYPSSGLLDRPTCRFSCVFLHITDILRSFPIPINGEDFFLVYRTIALWIPQITPVLLQFFDPLYAALPPPLYVNSRYNYGE